MLFVTLRPGVEKLNSPIIVPFFPYFSSTKHFFLYSLSFSISDIVNSKLGMPRPQIGQSISQQGFFSSRDSLSVPCVSQQPLHSYSATTSDMDLSRKNESKSTSKLKPGEQPLLGSWNPSTVAPRESIAHPTATSASTNHLNSNNGNGVTNNNADR
jgi:cyclic nucleotide gated channel alpha 3